MILLGIKLNILERLILEKFLLKKWKIKIKGAQTDRWLMLCSFFIMKSDLNLVKQVIKGAKNEQNSKEDYN